MGLGIKNKFVTRLEEDDENLFLSGYKPIKKEGKSGWFMPPNTCLGQDLVMIPNFFPDMKVDDEPMEVDVVESDVETGLWLVCADQYFGGEQWLVTCKKPYFKEDRPNEFKYDDESEYLHIMDSKVNAKSGNIYNVKLVKIGDEV